MDAALNVPLLRYPVHIDLQNLFLPKCQGEMEDTGEKEFWT